MVFLSTNAMLVQRKYLDVFIFFKGTLLSVGIPVDYFIGGVGHVFYLPN